jgi:SPP1 gp7 family putative phage head morphogenesis protein
MATATERLFDLDVQHQIGLSKYSTATVRKMRALLDRVDGDLQAQIRALSWEEVERQSAKVKRLNKLIEGIRVTLAEANGVVLKSLNKDLNELAAYEAEFQAGMIKRVATEVSSGFTVQPTAEQLKAAVHSRPFQGRILREWGRDWDAASFKRVRDSIRISFIEGESIENAIRRIRGTKALGYRDGVLEISKRGADTLVRTAISHVSNAAKEAFFAANPATIQGVIYSAVLDSRTTLRCASLHGKMFPVGKGPRPPQHCNCRSTTYACLPGDDPAKEESYSTWLRRQPAEVQDDALGKAKAQLFRRGGLDIEKFINASGKGYTLDQLRKRESAAFEKAGLVA